MEEYLKLDLSPEGNCICMKGFFKYIGANGMKKKFQLYIGKVQGPFGIHD